MVYNLISVKRAVILNNIRFETGYSFEIVSLSKHGSYDKNNVIEKITVNISRQSLKTPMLMYRVQYLKRRTAWFISFFVKRAVILNNIGFETGYSFEIVSLSKHSSYDKNNFIENITVNVSRQSLKTLKLIYRVQ